MFSFGTRAPLFACSSVSPSAARIRSASRTGSLLSPKNSAMSSCRMRSPGAMAPDRICLAQVVGDALAVGRGVEHVAVLTRFWRSNALPPG